MPLNRKLNRRETRLFARLCDTIETAGYPLTLDNYYVSLAIEESGLEKDVAKELLMIANSDCYANKFAK